MICRKCKVEIPDNSIFCLSCGKKQTVSARKPKARGNGAGTAYKRGRTWTAVVMCGKKPHPKTGEMVPDRRTKGGFATKREALEYIPTLREKKQAEAERPVSTLAMLWDGYSKSAMLKLSKSKQSHFKTAYKKIEDIQHKPISVLTINDLQDLVEEKTPTYYPAKDIKTLLSHLYTRAAAQQDVRTNLAEFIVLPDLEEGEQKPFDENDLMTLWEDYGNGNKMTGYILFMIYSGMMPGELRRCEKNMIDWEKQQIVGCGLKTKKRKETPIMVAGIMVPVLQDLCEYSQTDRLFVNFFENFYSGFHEALERCGIEDRPPYACRHTTATALALGNIAPGVIQNIMRHTKFSTTERYIHTELNTAPMLDALDSIPSKKSNASAKE